jgi:Transmembrane domain of unknown function (DUF3566)
VTTSENGSQDSGQVPGPDGASPDGAGRDGAIPGADPGTRGGKGRKGGRGRTARDASGRFVKASQPAVRTVAASGDAGTSGKLTAKVESPTDPGPELTPDAPPRREPTEGREEHVDSQPTASAGIPPPLPADIGRPSATDSPAAQDAARNPAEAGGPPAGNGRDRLAGPNQETIRRQNKARVVNSLLSGDMSGRAGAGEPAPVPSAERVGDMPAPWPGYPEEVSVERHAPWHGWRQDPPRSEASPETAPVVPLPADIVALPRDEQPETRRNTRNEVRNEAPPATPWSPQPGGLGDSAAASSHGGAPSWADPGTMNGPQATADAAPPGIATSGAPGPSAVGPSGVRDHGPGVPTGTGPPIENATGMFTGQRGGVPWGTEQRPTGLAPTAGEKPGIDSPPGAMPPPAASAAGAPPVGGPPAGAPPGDGPPGGLSFAGSSDLPPGAPPGGAPGGGPSGGAPGPVSTEPLNPPTGQPLGWLESPPPAAPVRVQPVRPVRAGRSRGGKPQAPAKSPRRAQLAIERIEPWSVMKFSFVISLVCFIVLFVAVTVLYGALAGLGVFDSLERTIQSLTSGQGSSDLHAATWFSASRILGYTGLIGAVNVILITAVATVGSVLYNVASDLIGGIEVTLRETE